MINTIKKAVEHFAYKCANVWGATTKDAEALDMIMGFVEDKHKKQIQDHQLFAKLYIVVYSQYLEKYKTTVFDDIPRKELTKLLSYSTEQLVQRFTDKLNESELYSLFETLDIDMSHPATKTQEIKDKETDKLQEALKDKDNFDKFNGKVWDYETVKENLELQINNTINLNL